MRERIPADDRLVVLHRERGRRRHELRGARQHGRIDIGPERQHVVAGLDRHHDLFQRRIAGALADAVDGAFDLARAAVHAGQRIRHRHAEIVMAMHREHRLVGIRHALAHHAEQRRIFFRRRIADRVGDIDRGGAGIDRGLHAAAQEIVLGAGAVLRRPFDIVGVIARARHLRDHHLEDLVRLLLQLVFHVYGRGGEEGMDALPRRRLDGLGAAVDVLRRRAGEPAHHRILRALGDLVHRGEIAFRSDRETGLDDVDAHVVEQAGDFQLLVMGHGGAGALLAVAQGGVEDDDAVLVGLCCRGHEMGSLSRAAPCSGAVSGFRSSRPLSAQANMPSRPSGARKEQETAENEGSTGSGCRRPGQSARIEALRHCQKPSKNQALSIVETG